VGTLPASRERAWYGKPRRGSHRYLQGCAVPRAERWKRGVLPLSLLHSFSRLSAKHANEKKLERETEGTERKWWESPNVLERNYRPAAWVGCRLVDAGPQQQTCCLTKVRTSFSVSGPVTPASPLCFLSHTHSHTHSHTPATINQTHFPTTTELRERQGIA